MARAFGFGLLIALGAPGTALAADPVSCHLERLASLDATALADGRLLVPVTINGTPEELMIDTGGVVSELSPGAAAALGLASHPVASGRFYDAVGRSATSAVTVEATTLGQLKIPSRSYLVMPVSPPPDEAPMAGLIGPDLLKPFDLELDPARHKVNLYDQNHCPGRVVYWSKAYVVTPLDVAPLGHAYLTMTLDGQSIRTAIDTGTSRTLLNVSAARRLFDLDFGAPGLLPDGAWPMGPQIFRYPFKSLAVEGIRIANPMIDLIPNLAPRPDTRMRGTPELEPASEGQPNLILGMRQLAQLHVYIAYGEQKLYATAADAK